MGLICLQRRSVNHLGFSRSSSYYLYVSSFFALKDERLNRRTARLLVCNLSAWRHACGGAKVRFKLSNRLRYFICGVAEISTNEFPRRSEREQARKAMNSQSEFAVINIISNPN
jgi:hypothetical protein